MSVSLMRCVSQRISETTSKTANIGLFIEAKVYNSMCYYSRAVVNSMYL